MDATNNLMNKAFGPKAPFRIERPTHAPDKGVL